MTIAASIRAHRDRTRTRERAAGYDSSRSEQECDALQLDLLNRSWERTVSAVPYWSERVAAGALPGRFASLEEFAARAPVTDRATWQKERSRLVSPERPPEFMRITGGSTAEPVQFPSWKSELDFTSIDMWMARDWYGLASDARLFLLWGHSHLLGSGWRGWLNARKREMRDRLLGYMRYSAYDLSRTALRGAAEALLRFRPELVLGYSVALDLFATANADRRSELRSAGVQLVLATAEGFPAPDTEERLRDLFQCPVGMEYGAVETGLVAHTHPDGGYRVFWRSYLVEAERVGSNHRIRVTSLYPRCTPLVRYELGDEVALGSGAPDHVASLRRFERVIGRCNDYVRLDDGFIAHSEVFTHAVRACSSVHSYQIVEDGSGPRLYYTAAESLLDTEEREIRARLGRVHLALSEMPFERVTSLRRTAAGKTPMVLRI